MKMDNAMSKGNSMDKHQSMKNDAMKNDAMKKGDAMEKMNMDSKAGK